MNDHNHWDWPISVTYAARGIRQYRHVCRTCGMILFESAVHTAAPGTDHPTRNITDRRDTSAMVVPLPTADLLRETHGGDVTGADDHDCYGENLRWTWHLDAEGRAVERWTCRVCDAVLYESELPQTPDEPATDDPITELSAGMWRDAGDEMGS